MSGGLDLVSEGGTGGRPSAPLETTLRALAPHIQRWVARHLGPGPDLDDATQEALIEVADALSRFEGRSKLTTYAHRITVRVALRHARRHRKRTRGHVPMEMVPLTEGATPEAVVLGREGIERLYRALDALAPKYRTAFVLCDVERLGHDEAAEVEGVKLATLRKRLVRARARLRQLLAQDPVLGAYLEGRG